MIYFLSKESVLSDAVDTNNLETLKTDYFLQAHIGDIFASKFTDFKNFHTMLYTCAAEFDFMEREVRGVKLFSCSTQLSLEFILLINVKMPTNVGIKTFINRINDWLW